VTPDYESKSPRTDLAEDRTILASERTFAGWMRTSFGAIAIGVGFHALFGEMQPSWSPRAIATGFLVLAMLLVILAERRAAAVLRRLNSHVVNTARPLNLRLYVAAVVAGASMLIAAIWLTY
jgi:putative membrane protein